MQSFFQDFRRDGGSQVTVEYHYEDGGTCVCIEKAWHSGPFATAATIGHDVLLNQEEDERMCEWIMENRWYGDHEQ